MSILFDLDGTLLDTAPDFAHAIQTLRAKMGLRPLSENVISSIRLAVPYGIENLVAIGFDKENYSNSQALLQENLLTEYQECLGYAAKPFPGILKLLNTLEERHIPWGVVTNKKSRFTLPLLEKLDLKHRAACIVSGDTTPHFKPHPEPLLHACQQLNVSPNHCVYIGDAELDIIAGNAAGMTTVAALFGYIEDKEATRKWNANHAVQHADEILPWFEQWHLSFHKY